MSTKTFIQVFPKIKVGGLERGAIEMAIFLATRGYLSIVVAERNDALLCKKLTTAGVKIIDLPIGRKSILNAYKMTKHLRHLINQYNPTIIHARSRLPIWITYFALKHFPDIPFITSCHGYHHDGPFNLKQIYNQAITLGDTVIYPSKALLDNYAARFTFTFSKSCVIPPAIDTEYFSINNINIDIKDKLYRAFKIKANMKVILMPARITRQKGIITLIQAIPLLINTLREDVKVVIMGSIDNRQYYQDCCNYIKAHHLEKHIIFSPPIHTMKEVYAISSIVVNASIKPESFGRSIYEAMSMKKLVVATNIGGALDVVTHLKNGFLVKPTDQNHLAKALLEAFIMPKDILKSITENARATVCNHSNAATNIGTLMVYEKARASKNKTIVRT